MHLNRLFLLFLITIFLCPYGIWAQTPRARYPQGLVPAYASQQAVITSKSMEAEIAQFRFIGIWHTAAEILEGTRTRRDDLKEQWLIAEAQYRENQIGLNSFIMAKSAYLNAEQEVLRNGNEVAQASGQARVQMHRVVEEGNPGQSRALEIAQQMREMLKSDLCALNGQMPLLDLRVLIFTKFVDNAQRMRRSRGQKLVTLLELREREASLRLTVRNQIAANDQIESLSETIDGLNRSITRLNGGRDLPFDPSCEPLDYRPDEIANPQRLELGQE